jgi:hypothetical protein
MISLTYDIVCITIKVGFVTEGVAASGDDIDEASSSEGHQVVAMVVEHLLPVSLTFLKRL